MHLAFAISEVPYLLAHRRNSITSVIVCSIATPLQIPPANMQVDLSRNYSYKPVFGLSHVEAY